MIIVLRPEVTESEVKRIRDRMMALGCQVNEYQSQNYRILGLLGDTSRIDPGLISGNRNVDKIIHVNEPYKKANRLFHPEDTIIRVGDRTIGGKDLAIIAGPCSVEGEDQITSIAREVKKAGAGFLRGGAFKPRTSPYSFQGIGEEALAYLKRAREETGLPIVSELMSVRMLDIFVREVDIIQVGSRNMQNFELLKLSLIHI